MLSAAAITVRRGDEFVNVAGLEGGMSRVRNQAEISLGPYPMQIPRGGRGADHVVASLHDGGRNVPDALHVVQQLSLAAPGNRGSRSNGIRCEPCRESEQVLAPHFLILSGLLLKKLVDASQTDHARAAATAAR